MKKWTDIAQFTHVVKYVRTHYSNLPTLLFRGTVKLHGSNAGIRRENGVYYAQGRNRMLAIGDDNYGFAAWLDNKLKGDAFKLNLDIMFDSIQESEHDVITVFGEWCGKGIQSIVAISDLPSKKFVIFAAHVNDRYVENTKSLNIPDDDIANVLDAGACFVGIDFNNPAASLEDIEKMTMAVDAQCPFGMIYGIDGIGEGLVWSCVELPINTDLMFKSKGPSHVGSKKTRKIVTVDPEKLAKISDVVEHVLPDWRLQQGFEHVDKLDITCTGQYLKWIGQDVKKEETDTLEVNDLVWTDIAKQVNLRAKEHFMQSLNASIF